MNLPMALTLFRLVLIPVFVLVFYLPFFWAGPAAALIFLLASITDWLDGYFARKNNQVSKLGAFLDPVADKLLVSVALVLLVSDANDTWRLYVTVATIILISREIMVSAMREWMAESGARSKVAVSFVGKLKASAQMAAIFFMLYTQPVNGWSGYHLGLALLMLSVLLALWSLGIYGRAALAQGHAMPEPDISEPKKLDSQH